MKKSRARGELECCELASTGPVLSERTEVLSAPLRNQGDPLLEDQVPVDQNNESTARVGIEDQLMEMEREVKSST